jgi:drug/metabolite transporter (DMT)-like permease
VSCAILSRSILGGRRGATLIGAVALLLWAALALLTTSTGAVPPFQLTTLTFALAFGLALVKWAAFRESPAAYLRQPLSVWAVGVGGLFGYHALYFLALKAAPPVEVSLIAYLWPLLIVVFSALLPGERLRWWHLAGALAGLLGTVLLVTDGGRVAFRAENALGYAAALGCALVWSSYSVASRRFGRVPSDVVGGFCGATALLALLCHLAFETWTRPSEGEWLAILGLGLGPVGIAFFVWDHGMKHGDIKALGALSYATPLVSTLLLVASGKAPPTPLIGLACLLVVGGAVLASRELWARTRTGLRHDAAGADDR